MEGLFHPQKPHKNLLFVDKNTLYKKDPNLESFIYIHGDYDSDYNNTTPSTYIAPQQVQE